MNKNKSINNKSNYLLTHGYILHKVIQINKNNRAEAYNKFNQLKQNKKYKWDYIENNITYCFDIFRARKKSKINEVNYENN